MFRLSRRNARPAGAEQVWAVASALLDYPTQQLLDSLDELAALVPASPGLQGLVDHLRSHDLATLQQDYVATFDHTRKCALYLTYFAYGDTRRRGVALVQFKQAYRKGGVEFDEDSAELPDHSRVVLQFGATVDPGGAWRLLNGHRAGLEMLRLALASWRNDDGSVGSPWLAAVAAVCETLPPLQGDEADAVRRLVEQGPPAEVVGLEPYVIDPLMNEAQHRFATPRREPEFLGMP